MKLRFRLLVLFIPFFFACGGDPVNSDGIDPDSAAENPPSLPEGGDSGKTEDDDDNNGGNSGNNQSEELSEPLPDAEFVEVKDSFMVTNANLQRFLDEVDYGDCKDDYSTSKGAYSYTKVTDYPGGAPGEADKPEAYVVEWEEDYGAGALTVHLSEGDWSGEYSLKRGATKASLTNLLPNTTYEYRIVAENGRTVAQGSFPTKGRLHLLYFTPNCRNGRDMGGWKTLDGKTVKYRKLYRGGEISSSYLSTTGKKDMLTEGIRAELDLRESKDFSKSQFASGNDDVIRFNGNFDKSYGSMFKTYPAKVKASFEFTVKCLRENRPLFFHCSIGRDRTGTFAALYLALLGVSESDINKDYELLYFAPATWSLNGGATSFTYSRTKSWTVGYACWYLWDYGKKDTLKESAEAYLLGIGVSQKDIDDFRALMLED